MKSKTEESHYPQSCAGIAITTEVNVASVTEECQHDGRHMCAEEACG